MIDVSFTTTFVRNIFFNLFFCVILKGFFYFFYFLQLVLKMSLCFSRNQSSLTCSLRPRTQSLLPLTPPRVTERAANPSWSPPPEPVGLEQFTPLFLWTLQYSAGLSLQPLPVNAYNCPRCDEGDCNSSHLQL